MKKLKNEDSVKIQRTLLALLGLWPNKSRTFFSKLQTASSFFVAYWNILAMFHLLCTTKDLGRFLRNLNLFLPFFTVTLKTTIFYFNWSKMLRLLDFLQSPIFYSYPDDLEKYLTRAIRTSYLIMTLFRIIVFPTVLLIFSIPLLNPGHGRDLPFDYGMMNVIERSKFFYVTLYFFQGLALIWAALSNMAVDGVPNGLMGLAAAHFEVLQGKIVQVTESFALNQDKYGQFDEEINERLKECVELHLGAVTFAQMIEEIFTYSFLLQFIVSGVSICVAGFMFIITSPGSFEFLMTLGVLGTLLFQISLYCIFGDEVIYQSLKVENACYMTDWTFCGPTVRKTLFIIMERSKRPSVLTAGKFVQLSLTSLVAILRSAFSYGTILKQFYK